MNLFLHRLLLWTVSACAVTAIIVFELLAVAHVVGVMPITFQACFNTAGILLACMFAAGRLETQIRRIEWKELRRND